MTVATAKELSERKGAAAFLKRTTHINSVTVQTPLFKHLADRQLSLPF